MDDLEKLKKNLQECSPSLFVLIEDVQKHHTKTEIARIIKKISEDEVTNKEKTTTEERQSLNLITVLNFYLNESDEAYRLNTTVLEKFPRSINAQLNKAWMHLLEERNLDEIPSIIEYVHELMTNPYSKIQAKAELAYGYSRLGSEVYHKAVRLFEEVVKDATSIDTSTHFNTQESDQGANTVSELKEDICLWTYGLALTERRRLNIYNLHSVVDTDYSKRHVLKVIKLYEKVTELNNEIGSQFIKRDQGRSLAEIGILAYTLEKLFSESIDAESKYVVEKGWMAYFEEALEIGDKDYFVLQQCGKHFRYKSAADGVERSIQVLNEALKMRPDSSFAHHHLALSLKRRLEMQGWSRAPSSGKKFSRPREENWRKPTFDSSKQRLKLLNSIKSPKEVQRINVDKHSSDAKEIFDHLDKAVMLASSNTSAKYDKGYFFRQIGCYKDALKIFLCLIRRKEYPCSLLQLANAYEQAAFCICDITNNFEEEISSYDGDFRCYLKRSIELSCIIVAKIPHLKDCWSGPQTLQDFIESGPKTKRNLEDLVFLHEKLKRYKEVISTLNELANMYEEDSKKAETLNKTIKLHYENKMYDDAILTTDILLCLPNGDSFVNKQLYIESHVRGGIEALRKQEKEVATLRFKNALHFSASNQSVQETNTDDVSVADENTWDIFVLCEEVVEEKWWAFVHVLKDTGLSITFNSNDVGGLASNINKSKHFIIAFDSEVEKEIPSMEMYISKVKSQLQERQFSKNIVVSDESTVALPTLLRGISQVKVCLDKMSDRENKWEDEDVRECVFKVLCALAMV